MLIAVPGLPAIQAIFGKFPFLPSGFYQVSVAREEAAGVFFQCAFYLVRPRDLKKSGWFPIWLGSETWQFFILKLAKYLASWQAFAIRPRKSSDWLK